ncbi:hypothetical protein LIN78_04830 [Leeia sp. TBRC 13508]|uniref:Uncharacterized protein n=1 Tax=Leeia speluncae TaxID=2884804 RepID=A0ABS8D3U8_9NEIS|nr:hypothetical protein [Leeia speluncae]MCB6182874.1 hypothetical protein [Leeia speluncae]
MSLSKEQLLKLYGIKLKPVEADCDVLSRRPQLVFRLQWCLRNSAYFHLVIAIVSFLLILLPSISKDAYSMIGQSAFLLMIHSAFLFNKSLYLLIFIFVGLIGVIGRASELHRTYESGSTAIDYKQMMEMELYPRTKLEERWFYISLFVYMSFPAIWPLIFCVISFLLRTK